MQKKHLGRGLEDITNIFISQKTESDATNDSIPADPQTVVDGSKPEITNKASEVNVPISENDKISAMVDRQNEGDQNSKPEPFYLYDQVGKDDGHRSQYSDNSPNDCANDCEITEHVSINRNMAFSNTPEVQQNIVNSLFQYLGQKYEIKKIELAKENSVAKPGMTNIIKENILIYIKKGAKNG